MRPISIMKHASLFLLSAAVFLCACTPAPADPGIASPQTSPTKSEQAAASATSSPTPLPSPSPSLTPTMVPSNTPIPTPTATPTQTFNFAKLSKVEKDLTYCTIGSTALKMDVYYPANGDQPWPAVIYVHGGRWTAGDKAYSAGLRYFDGLLAENMMVVSVNYRLAPEHIFPAALEDIKCAVRHLRANAGFYNIHPLKIGAFGTSAGGHLTSMLALAGPGAGYDSAGGYQETSSRIQAVASLYAPSDFSFSCKNDLVSLIFGAANCKDTGTLLPASPLNYVGPNAPPFLLIHGTDDSVVPIKHSRVLYRSLVDAGAKNVTLIEVENAGHGFLAVGGGIKPSKGEIARLLIDFFARYLQ